jgi:hypothetical protein
MGRAQADPFLFVNLPQSIVFLTIPVVTLLLNSILAYTPNRPALTYPHCR